MLTEKVTHGEIDYGTFRCQGIIAQEAIEAGERVWWTGEADVLEEYSYLDIANEPDQKRREFLKMYSYAIAIDTLGSTKAEATDADFDTSYYFNHSCDPNCGYQDDDTLVALRRIEAGEHVVYDYAFTETEMSFHAGMQCLCGAAQCRGLLTFSNYRDPVFMAKNKEHCMSHIVAQSQQVGWNDPRTCLVREKSGSRTVYTLKEIKKGETVLVWGGKTVDEKTIRGLGEETVRYSAQVSSGLWHVPVVCNPVTEIADEVTHSCDPSCGMLDAVTIVARRDLPPLTPVTIDYATVASKAIMESVESFECECGAENCRKKVATDDYRLPSVRETLFDYFPPWLKKVVAEEA